MSGAPIGEPIEGEAAKILEKTFVSGFRFGYKKYRGVALPSRHDDFTEKVENFEVRNDDVWVVSYPKTGTTWTQEMVWCIANDLDFENAKELLPIRFPFLDHSSLFDYSEVMPKYPDVELPDFILDAPAVIDKIKSPRFIKTHFPWPLLPASIRNGTKKPKIIYVCRNAKDTCVSYFHHCVLLEAFTGSFEDFCKLYLNDAVCYSPFWSHIEEFWKRRDESNIYFLTYEQLKADLPGVVKDMSKFLGKDLSPDEVSTLCEHLSFKSMKNNRSVNYEAAVDLNRIMKMIPEDGEFMRSGTGGEWKAKMDEETIEKFDKWIQSNLERTGIVF